MNKQVRILRRVNAICRTRKGCCIIFPPTHSDGISDSLFELVSALMYAERYDIASLVLFFGAFE